jgi:hypothetical protein
MYYIEASSLSLQIYTDCISLLGVEKGHTLVMKIKSQLVVVALVLTLGMLLLVLGCSDDWGCKHVRYPASNARKVTIKQGMWGDVWFWQGDFMPVCPSGTVTAVAREMRIYELTSSDQVDYAGSGTFYSAIHTQLVATTHSDNKGFFQVELPAGWYSLFAVEDTLFYANLFDGSGNIFPVLVEEGKVTDAHFDIDYLSTW